MRARRWKRPGRAALLCAIWLGLASGSARGAALTCAQGSELVDDCDAGRASACATIEGYSAGVLDTLSALLCFTADTRCDCLQALGNDAERSDALLLEFRRQLGNCGPRDPLQGPSFNAALQLCDSLPPSAEDKRWSLIWSDDFDGTSLDRNRWETPEGPRRDGYWSRQDSALDGDGHLVIRTRERNGEYFSGAIRTKGAFEHRYGYWVARCKMPTQPGHWPAFWLMSPGVETLGNEGRDGTEIDIMERFVVDSGYINHALYWDGYGPELRGEAEFVEVPRLSDGFHTFGVHWTPDEYVFYVDGRETWRTSAGGVSQVPAYIKLTDEVGTLAGDIRLASLPDSFIVDYVRVYDLGAEEAP